MIETLKLIKSIRVKKTLSTVQTDLNKKEFKFLEDSDFAKLKKKHLLDEMKTKRN